MASSKVPPGDSDAFLAMMRTQSCPVGADYVSWLNGLCVGWQERRAAAGLAVPPPATAGDDRSRGCVVAFCADHAEVEVVTGPFCPVCSMGRVLDDGVRLGRTAKWPTTPAPEAKCEMCGGPHVRDVFHAADLQPPAPEAKRPEWVRIVKSESPSRFKDGDVLRVVKWVDEVPAVDVDGYDVSGYVLYDSKWAPAPCPPPVAGRGETLPDNVREFLLDVEYAAKWANQPQGPAAEYVKGRLEELAALAHDILSRPVRP